MENKLKCPQCNTELTYLTTGNAEESKKQVYCLPILKSDSNIDIHDSLYVQALKCNICDYIELHVGNLG